MKVKALDYHRNGICGAGFHVGVVEDDGREMLVVRFSGIDKTVGAVVVAAFDLAKLDQREIRFLHNSWCGDHYREVMDEAIKKDNADDSDD